FSTKVSDLVPRADIENFFLVSMVQQWSNAKDQPALIRADRALAFAYETNRLVHEDIIGNAHLAMQQNNLEAAARLYEQALKHAPHDKGAEAGLKLVADL